MNKRTSIVLGVFAVPLVAVLVACGDRASVGVRKPEPPRVDKVQLTALEFGGAHAVRLEKEGPRWWVMDPAKPDQKYVADEARVTHALESLVELRSADFVTDRPEAQAEDELDAAKGLPLKVMGAGATPLELVIGKTGKSGGYYIREAGSNEVFLARGGLASAGHRDVKEWRNRELVSLKPEDLSQLTLRAKTGEALTLDAGTIPGEWSVARGTKLPADFRLDPDPVNQVARQLTSLTAQDFLEGDAAQDAATGLGGPHDTIEAKLKGGKTLVVHLGASPEGKPEAPVAARLDGDPQVYQLASYSAGLLRKRPTDLRDLRLLHFAPSKVTRLKVQAGTTSVQLAREGPQWKLIEPRTPPPDFTLDSHQVETLITWLGSLRATRLLEGTSSDAQLGVNAPTALVEVSLEAAPSQTLRLGKTAPANTDGPPEVYARSSLDARSYTLPEVLKTRFAQGLELFKKPGIPPGVHRTEGLDKRP